jgi:hypothetical protein
LDKLDEKWLRKSEQGRQANFAPSVGRRWSGDKRFERDPTRVNDWKRQLL